MGEVVLPASTETVALEEIPALLAMAKHPRSQTGRVVSYLMRRGARRQLERPLNALAEDVLCRIWSCAPPAWEGLTEAEWGKWGASFHRSRLAPKGWAPVPVWRNEELNAAVLRADAERMYRDELRGAIARGGLVARNHAGLPSSGFASDTVDVEALRAFAAPLGLSVRIGAPQAEEAPEAKSQAEAPSPTLASRANAVDLPPLPTRAIAFAFDGIANTSTAQWLAKLGDVNNYCWLQPARVNRGKAPTPATWDPLIMARILSQRGASADSLKQAFMRVPALKPWSALWLDEVRERNAFGM